MIKRFVMFLLVILVASACSKSASPALPTITPVSGTAAVPPTSLPPIPEQTPTSAASPTPFIAFNVNPSVDSLKLRLGPGYLFDALLLLNQDEVLTVQGKAPGGEWVFVETQGGVTGWVFAELLKSDVDLQATPIIEPGNTLTIKGRVTDINGTPIQGAGFEVKQGEGDSALTNTVITDAKGEFYSYMPVYVSGTWTLTYTAIACKSNVWADTKCSTYKPGYSGTVDPQSQTVTLPQSGMLAFLWK